MENISRYVDRKREDEPYRILHPWDQPTGRSVDDLAAKQAAKDYRFSNPWESDEAGHLADFERDLENMNMKHSRHPWETGSEDVSNLNTEKEKAKEYKYQSLFEPEPLTEQQKKTIAEYKVVPPFQTETNQIKEKSGRLSKKIMANGPGSIKTKDPWSYGIDTDNLPADPNPIRVYDKPTTVLWDVDSPKNDNKSKFESSGNAVLDSLRQQLLSHGAAGIMGLSRKFRIMDDDETGVLSFEEFDKGMRELKLAYLMPKALKHLFNYFDKDESGTISYSEFLVGVRGVLSARRKSMVYEAFSLLDSDGSGIVDLHDIEGVYNCKSHPDVLSGRRTEGEVLSEFILHFGGSRKRSEQERKEASISLQDFEDYYANISASIDDDNYFELMIRNAWHISGGVGAAANTSNRRILVTRADGSQAVQEVKKNELRLNSLSKSEQRAVLAKLVNATKEEAPSSRRTSQDFGTPSNPNLNFSNGDGRRGSTSSTQPVPYRNSLAAYAMQQPKS